MLCPKCKHEQESSIECEVCGVIFEKYRMVQERKREADILAAEKAQDSGTVRKILQVVILVVVVAAGTYYFTGYRQPKPLNQVTLKSPTVATVASLPVKRQVAKRVVQAQQPSVHPVMIRQNVIERARDSTVSIETPWGTGSGFFVNKNYIVTNRHVVEFDEEKLAELKRRIEKTRRMIELEQQKINEMRRTFRQLPKGPSRSQLAIIIASHEKELNNFLPKGSRGKTVGET